MSVLQLFYKSSLLSFIPNPSDLIYSKGSKIDILLRSKDRMKSPNDITINVLHSTHFHETYLIFNDTFSYFIDMDSRLVFLLLKVEILVRTRMSRPKDTSFQ